MNCYKTAVFRNLFGCAVCALLFFSFSNVTIAQSRTLSASFNNFVAAAGRNDDAGLKRPRIFVPVNAKTEATKTNVETSESNSVMLTMQLEREAFSVLNAKRAEKGLPPLVWSEDMARVARSHSQEMAQFKFFSHAGRNGSMVDDRADSFGFKKWKAIGENIAYNRGYENPAEFACERWMQSVSHRENILNPRWKEAGIGVAITTDGTYYFTEVFIVR